MIRKSTRTFRPYLWLLAAAGILLWMFHPVVHHVNDHADSHHSSETGGLPDAADDDCLECILTTTMFLKSDASPDRQLPVSEPTVLKTDFDPVSSFPGHGFSLRAPPGYCV